jgi:hypothetical protein
MKTFLEFLAESHSAPLYHGTTVDRLESIMHQNTLEGRISEGEDDNKTKVVSLTRSLKYALDWATTLSRSKINAVVIELDQRKIRQRYKLQTYNFYHTQVPFHMAKSRYLKDDPVYGMNEYEERIVNKNLTNIRSYITAFHVASPTAFERIEHFGFPVKSDLLK